tara:strand:- start:235 stop:492 length:258 start_codon:yes stop_codon:yes gene_type:complete
MKKAYFDKLCKELEEWEIIEQSLGMIRLTTKFRKLIVKNFIESKTDKDAEPIVLSVLDVIGTVEQERLCDYYCIIKGTLPHVDHV